MASMKEGQSVIAIRVITGEKFAVLKETKGTVKLSAGDVLLVAFDGLNGNIINVTAHADVEDIGVYFERKSNALEATVNELKAALEQEKSDCDAIIAAFRAALYPHAS